MRAIDVWVVLCYVGVFFSLMEYCIVIYLTKDSDLASASTEHGGEESPKTSDLDQKKILRRNLARKIEKTSRILLPTYNLLFFTLFFVICLTKNTQ